MSDVTHLVVPPGRLRYAPTLCCLLQEILATCYMKLSGATVKSHWEL